MARAPIVLGIVLAVSPTLSAQSVTELRMGEASGEPGEVVDMAVTASFTHPVSWFYLALSWDDERLLFLGWMAEGTVSQGSDPIFHFWREWAPGVGIFGMFPPVGEAGDDFQIPPGEHLLLAKVFFQVLATAPAGEAAVTPVASARGVPPGWETLPGDTGFGLVVEEEPGFVRGVPERYLGGAVHVREWSGPRPVGDLTCGQVAASPT